MVNTAKPDERAVMTYVSSYYHAFTSSQKVLCTWKTFSQLLDTKYVFGNSNYTIQLHSAKHLTYRYIFTPITQLLRKYIIICCWRNLAKHSLQKFKLVICIFHQLHCYIYVVLETETHHPIDFVNQSCHTL